MWWVKRGQCTIWLLCTKDGPVGCETKQSNKNSQIKTFTQIGLFEANINSWCWDNVKLLITVSLMLNNWLSFLTITILKTLRLCANNLLLQRSWDAFSLVCARVKTPFWTFCSVDFLFVFNQNRLQIICVTSYIRDYWDVNLNSFSILIFVQLVPANWKSLANHIATDLFQIIFKRKFRKLPAWWTG